MLLLLWYFFIIKFFPHFTVKEKIYKYNLRAALTVASGKSTNAFVLVTGTQAVTGTTSVLNNGRIGILGHGPGSGIKSFYFVINWLYSVSVWRFTCVLSFECEDISFVWKRKAQNVYFYKSLFLVLHKSMVRTETNNERH